jgi:hypothetical protein
MHEWVSEWLGGCLGSYIEVICESKLSRQLIASEWILASFSPASVVLKHVGYKFLNCSAYQANYSILSRLLNKPEAV